MINKLKQLVEEYLEDTQKRMSTDNVNYYYVKQTDPKLNDFMEWLEDRPVYSIEPREVIIEVEDGT